MSTQGKRNALATIGLVATLVAGVTWMMTSSAGAAPAKEAPPTAACATPPGCSPGARHEPEPVSPALTPYARKFAMRASDDTQTLDLQGTGFVTGLSVRVAAPFGEYVTTYSGRSIAAVTPTSVRIPARLVEKGTYTVVVRNPDGARSNEIPLVVR